MIRALLITAGIVMQTLITVFLILTIMIVFERTVMEGQIRQTPYNYCECNKNGSCYRPSGNNLKLGAKYE